MATREKDPEDGGEGVGAPITPAPSSHRIERDGDAPATPRLVVDGDRSGDGGTAASTGRSTFRPFLSRVANTDRGTGAGDDPDPDTTEPQAAQTAAGSGAAATQPPAEPTAMAETAGKPRADRPPKTADVAPRVMADPGRTPPQPPSPPLPHDLPAMPTGGRAWPIWVGAVVSFLWLGLFAVYVHQSVGWNTLFLLLPHEFAGFLAGALTPVALVWALVAVFNRDGRYGREAVALRQQLSKLTYPTEGARDQMNDVARSLSDQARQLTDASRQALSEARQVRDGLRGEVVALSSLADKFRDDIAQVIRDTESQVYGLEDATDRAVARARDASGTLERQSASLGEAAERLLTRSGTLEETLRKHVHDLTLAGQQARDQGNALRQVNDSVTRSLDEGRALSEAFTTLLGDLEGRLDGHQGRLDDMRARWEKSGEGVAEALGQRAHELDQLSERMLGRTQVIEGTIGHQTDALMTASDQAMARLKEMEGVFTRRVQSMSGIVDTATEKLADASLSVAERGQEAASATGSATETLERAATALDAILRNLASAVQRTEQRARDAGAVVREQAETLEAHTTEANRQAGFIREAIAAQAAELADGARLIGHQVEVAQGALAQQARHLADSASAACGRIGDTVDGLRESMTSLSSLSNQVQTDLDGVGNHLEARTHALQAAGDRTVEHSRAAAEAVRTETESLQAQVAQVQESLAGLENSLAARVHAISGAAEGARSRLDETAGVIEGKARVLSEQADQANSALEATAGVMDRRIGHADGLVERVLARLADVGTALEHQARQFEEVTGRGLSQATVAGNRLRQSTDGLQAAAEKAAETVRGAASLLGGSMEEADARVRALIPELEGSAGAIRQQVDGMAQSGEKVSDTIRRLGMEFARHGELLGQVALKAEERAASLRAEMDRAEVTTFLHQASFLIERLESNAVDIARIFNPVRDEDLWRRYQKGDHGVFLRHLARVMTVKQHSAVRELFEMDREFRAYVGQFVTDYESLLDQVRQTARADILTALFIGSDLGKVYLVLAKALGRLEE